MVFAVDEGNETDVDYSSKGQLINDIAQDSWWSSECVRVCVRLG